MHEILVVSTTVKMSFSNKSFDGLFLVLITLIYRSLSSKFWNNFVVLEKIYHFNVSSIQTAWICEDFIYFSFYFLFLLILIHYFLYSEIPKGENYFIYLFIFKEIAFFRSFVIVTRNVFTLIFHKNTNPNTIFGVNKFGVLIFRSCAV